MTASTELRERFEQVDAMYRDAITDLALTMACSEPMPEKPTSVRGLWTALAHHKAMQRLAQPRGH